MMERHKMGMLLFIGSEIVFFSALIITYVRYRQAPGASAATHFDVPIIALFSLALFASSATIEIAVRRFHRGDNRGLRTWLLVTMALGIIFLLGQALEYRDLWFHGVDLGAGVFASAFFLLTGFHGLHVIGGLVAILVLWSASRSSAFTGRGIGAVTPVSLYWHFVDGVWVVVFSVVYLWAFLT